MKKVLVLVVALSMLMFTVASAKTKITWLGWYPTQENFVEIKKGFEAENPDIELEATRFMYDDYVNKLKQEFGSGTGPDVMSIQEGAFFNQFKPYLADLTSKIGGFEPNLQPTVLAGAKKLGDGKLYYVPIGMGGTMVVYINATMLEKAGVKVPTTGAELIAAVKTLKAKYPDKVGVATGLKDGWWATDTFMIFANMVSPGITQKADKGEVKWNSKEFVDAMKLLQSMVKEGVIPKESVGLAEYEDAIGLLMDGKAVMHLNGTWNAGNLSKEFGDRRKGRATENDKFTAIMLPNLAGGKTVALGGMDVGIGINKNSKNFDACLKLVQYMTTGKGQEYFAGQKGSGLIPVKKGLSFNMAAYPDKEGQAGANNITKGFSEAFVGPREVSNTSVKNQLAVVVQNVVNGADVQKELDALQKIAERQ